jgi:integral membrane protein
VPPTPLGQFRLVGLIEGVSYLLLLGVAVPLKRLADIHQPTKYLGSIHGGLFILFCLLLLRVAISRKWHWSRAALMFAASLIPFGTFFVDGTLRLELAQEARESKSSAG